MESKLFPPTILCLGIQATRPFLLCFWCCTSSSKANAENCETLSESCCGFFFSLFTITPNPTFFPSYFSCSANSQLSDRLETAGARRLHLRTVLLLRQCLFCNCVGLTDLAQLLMAFSQTSLFEAHNNFSVIWVLSDSNLGQCGCACYFCINSSCLILKSFEFPIQLLIYLWLVNGWQCLNSLSCWAISRAQLPSFFGDVFITITYNTLSTFYVLIIIL